MNINDDYLLATRTYPNSYPRNAIENIILLSVRDHGIYPGPVGSYTYPAQKYPGDIDLFETFSKCCTEDQVIGEFKVKFQDIVRKIVKAREHYMTRSKSWT